MRFVKWWEYVFVRIMSYIVLALLLLGGWRIVNAQQSATLCRTVGEQIVCTTTLTVQVPVGTPFDPSVIGKISDPTPEQLRYLNVRKCMIKGIAEGLSDDQIMARCVK